MSRIVVGSTLRKHSEFRPGDVVLMQTKGLVGKAIRIAQRRLLEHRYAHWNHVGILHEQVGRDWTVIQAQPRGITDDGLLSEMAGDNYEIIALPSYIHPSDVLAFAKAQVGKQYGFASVLSAALDMVLPRQVCLRKADTWICSGLVMAALWYAGLPASLHIDDLYSITPAEIANILGT